MNITPTPEFQRAFKFVTGLECSPENLVTAIRENPDLFQQVREMHADIVMLARQRRLITELKQRLEKHKPDIKQEETRAMNEIVKRNSTAVAADGWDDTAAEAEARLIRGSLLKFS